MVVRACVSQTLSREFEIDFISLSYTRTEEDVHEAREWLNSIGCGATRILAKIETRQSLLNFEGILAAADGIIISRGQYYGCPVISRVSALPVHTV